jgi:hypothetical protein
MFCSRAPVSRHEYAVLLDRARVILMVLVWSADLATVIASSARRGLRWWKSADMQQRATRKGSAVMALLFVAKDPESQPDGSPTLYRTDRHSWIVQGSIVTDPGELAQLNLPPGETACEIPDRLVPFFMQQEE